MGLSVWCCDQAGPFQTIPQEGQSWQPEGKAARTPHEYFRNGTAKILTLFHPANGQVRVEGTVSCTNPVLHGWLRWERIAILQTPLVSAEAPFVSRTLWDAWQAGLTEKPPLPETLPPLRMLLVLDNLAGHKTPEFVDWLLANGIIPLYTPLGGSWLNLAESIQRVLKRRALNGQHPSSPEQIMGWFEAVAAHWNRAPTPFVWGGKRQARRERQRERRHRLGGSGGYTRTPIRSRTKCAYVGVHDK